MIQNIKFKRVKSNFQARPSGDVRNIKKTQKLLIAAGKTVNLYKLTTDK